MGVGVVWGGASHDLLKPPTGKTHCRLQDPAVTSGTECVAGHPGCASRAPAQKVSPLLTCRGSQVLEGAQPTARCVRPSVPWAHVVLCPPGCLQWVHPWPFLKPLPCAARPSQSWWAGWALPSSPGISANPPHTLRTALSLGKVGPWTRSLWRSGSSHPPDPRFKDTVSPLGLLCKLQGMAQPQERCTSPCANPMAWPPDGAWLAVPRVLWMRSLGDRVLVQDTGLNWERRLPSGSSWSSSSPPPGSSSPRCAVCGERGSFTLTPSPQLGACFWDRH